MADQFERFTSSGREVLIFAQEEAMQFNHHYVGTEHLLLGLTRLEGDSMATLILRRLQVDLAKVRAAVEFIIGRGDRPVMGEIELSSRAKIVVKFALDEAQRLNHNYVGPEHILLGLVREGEGIAAGVLESLGASQIEVRAEFDKMTSAVYSHPLSAVPAEIIDGKAIAEQVRAEVAERAKRLREVSGVTPGLALVLAGDNPSSLSYVRSKGDTAEEAGLFSQMFHLPEDTPEEQIIAQVREINAAPRFHGILVQLPLPKQMREDAVIAAIDPAKDADGVTATSLGKLLRGEPGPWPATPAGVVELLNRTGHVPSGKHVVVCGRSNIVGKPIAAILMQKNDRANATVTLCHTGTPVLADYTRQADILIAAMGVAGAITADMVKPGAVVIDVGNNWVEDATRKSGRRLVGDVDYDSVSEVAGAITPVPGGVGPMTIAMLLSNTVMLAEKSAAKR